MLGGESFVVLAEGLQNALWTLGGVPLELEIRERSDSGRPVVATLPDGAHSKIYKEMAQKLWDIVNGTPARKTPKIVID